MTIPFTSDLEMYNLGVAQLELIGLTIKSPIIWDMDDHLIIRVNRDLASLGVSNSFIKRNSYGDTEFFFHCDEDYSFFLIKYSYLIAERVNV